MPAVPAPLGQENQHQLRFWKGGAELRNSQDSDFGLLARPRVTRMQGRAIGECEDQTCTKSVQNCDLHSEDVS